MKLFLFLLGYVSIGSRCLPTNPRSGASQAFTAYEFRNEETHTTDKIGPEHRLSDPVKDRPHKLQPETTAPCQDAFRAIIACTLSKRGHAHLPYPHTPNSRHHHHPGEPYLKDMEYFGWELPGGDKAAFVYTGKWRHTIHWHRALKYNKHSENNIDPVMNEPERELKYCDEGFKPRVRYPSRSECCWSNFTAWCRTYMLRPQ